MRWRWMLPLLVLATPACDRGAEDAGAECKVTRTTLTLDEASALGFTANELLTNMEGAYNTTLVWFDGASTELSITLDYTSGDVSYVDLEVDESAEGDMAQQICEDYVEVPMQVTFETADGSFSESWSIALNAPAVDSASFQKELDLDALQGSYDIRALDPSEYDKVSAWIYADFSNRETTGKIMEQGEKQEGETASATGTEAGVWPGED